MEQSDHSPTPFPPGAEIRETHLSWVVLVGDLALKVLKPRRTAFVDQRTVAQRAEACRREVDLNRRLAPDVYLGTSPVVTDSGVVEHLVVMRRLPQDRALSALVGSPELGPAAAAVARTLATFHARLAPDPRPDEVASPAALLDLWDRSLDELAVLLAPSDPTDPSDRSGPDRAGPDEADPALHVPALRRLAHRWLAGRGPLLAERIDGGRVVDGHGDLLADDVFVLPDGPRLLDCLAFDDRLRRGDVLGDVAFLAMDLERLAGPAAADRFVRDYQEFAGEQHPPSLQHHYVAYRALVRAKVALLRHPQTAGGLPDVTARTLLHLCRDHLERGRVTLTLVGGGPGTGKSTLAERLAAERGDGTTVVSTDLVRTELDGRHTGPGDGPRLDEGRYEPSEVARTYDEVLRRAARLLGRGLPVVLDASWPDRAGRERAREVARRTSSDLVELCCTADPVTAAARVRRRRLHTDDPSEADPVLVGALTARRAPWPEAVHVSATTVAEALAMARRAAARTP